MKKGEGEEGEEDDEEESGPDSPLKDGGGLGGLDIGGDAGEALEEIN